MEYSNGTSEPYRYHTPYDTSTYPSVPHSSSPETFQMGGAPVSRRFHPYAPGNESHPDSGPTGHFAGYPAVHQCDQCGAVFENVHVLAEHVQSHHYNAIFPDTYSAQPVKAEGTSETAEILDLDSHKVHVYQPPGGGSGAPNNPAVSAPPYNPSIPTPPLSLPNPSPMGWMAPNPPIHAVAPPPPPQQHDPYRPAGGNSYPGYEMIPSSHNGSGHAKPVAHPPSGWKASNPPGSGGGGGGGPGGGEVRRPKTYNCEACNKWFTSSGHLKRHYNTTLHKNAIKAGNGNAADPGRRSGTPSSRSISSPPDSEEPSLERKPEDVPIQPTSAVSPEISDTYRPPPQIVPQQVSTPYMQQQQQQYSMQGQSMQHVDHYRLPYQVSNPYYCPPGAPGARPMVPNPVSVASPFGGQYLHPQQGGYPPNSMMYPPNLIAPLPSSNVHAPGAGLAASLFVNNNNNIDERKEDLDSFKAELSDASSRSEGSPDHMDELENDGSDSELHERKKNSTAESPGAKRGISAGGDVTGNFKCNQCHKEFNRVCYLTQHNNTFHKGDKPFKCHMCGKRFQNAELFSQHQQKHAGDKPYKCGLCPKQFNHKTDLRRHMCLHTGQKPFMCQVCNKGFIRKDHMVKHVQTHTRRNAAHHATATTPSL